MRKSFKANLKATMETIVTITLATLCMCVFCQPAHAATETLLDSITKVESTSTGTLYTFNDGTGYYSENFAAPTLKYSMNGNYYPLTGIITSIAPDSDSRENVITLECGNGNMFQFTDSIDADWDTYDLVSCIMDNKGTPIVHDDEVITTMYAGYTGQFQEIEGRD